jgi:hypothetical protein
MRECVVFVYELLFVWLSPLFLIFGMWVIFDVALARSSDSMGNSIGEELNIGDLGI